MNDLRGRPGWSLSGARIYVQVFMEKIFGFSASRYSRWYIVFLRVVGSRIQQRKGRPVGMDLKQPETVSRASFSWEFTLDACALWHRWASENVKRAAVWACILTLQRVARRIRRRYTQICRICNCRFFPGEDATYGWSSAQWLLMWNTELTVLFEESFRA